MDRLLTANEIADHYRVSVETLKVWRWRLSRGEAGFPPFKKIGRLVRYSATEFDRWINDRQQFICKSDVSALGVTEDE